MLSETGLTVYVNDFFQAVEIESANFSKPVTASIWKFLITAAINLRGKHVVELSFFFSCLTTSWLKFNRLMVKIQPLDGWKFSSLTRAR